MIFHLIGGGSPPIFLFTFIAKYDLIYGMGVYKKTIIDNREKNIIERLNSGRTYQEVGKEYGMTKQGIRSIIKRLGYSRIDFQMKRRRVIYFSKCNFCKKIFIPSYRLQLFCSKKCLSLAFRTITVNKGKYHQITRHGVHIYKHRELYMKLNGLNLTSNQCVHHLDGNRENNNIENLVVINRKGHSNMEAKLAWSKLKSRFDIKPVFVKRKLSKFEIKKILHLQDFNIY